jgi:hypothetical protein
MSSICKHAAFPRHHVLLQPAGISILADVLCCALLWPGVLNYAFSDYLWAHAVLLLGPTIATLGLSVQIPIAAVAEAVWGHPRWLTSGATIGMTVAGTLLIMAGFFWGNLAGKGPVPGSHHRNEGESCRESCCEMGLLLWWVRGCVVNEGVACCTLCGVGRRTSHSKAATTSEGCVQRILASHQAWSKLNVQCVGFALCGLAHSWSVAEGLLHLSCCCCR